MKLFRLKSDDSMTAVALSQVTAISVTFAEAADARHSIEFFLSNGLVMDASISTAELEAFVKAWEVSQ
jgi:hypothetical protein